MNYEERYENDLNQTRRRYLYFQSQQVCLVGECICESDQVIQSYLLFFSIMEGEFEYADYLITRSDLKPLDIEINVDLYNHIFNVDLDEYCYGEYYCDFCEGSCNQGDRYDINLESYTLLDCIIDPAAIRYIVNHPSYDPSILNVQHLAKLKDTLQIAYPSLETDQKITLFSKLITYPRMDIPSTAQMICDFLYINC